MRHHGLIGLLLGNGVFLVGNLALSVLAFSFSVFFSAGRKVASTMDLGWQSKGEDHFRSWWWQLCIVQILSGPKTFLYISFVFFRCLIGNFLSFLLSLNLWLGIFFFCSQSLIGNFLLLLSSDLWSGTFFFCFVFFWRRGWAFSPWVKVYGELGFWLKACRTARHDICQSVGLASGLGIKGMSHIISMAHMQQWWLGNFMQNWSCMHLCGHSTIKFLWSCDTGAQDSFSLFKSTQCFQNMLIYQFMHSSESILGVWESFHSIHPSSAYTFFFKNWCYD